ncbi:MAG: ScbR family autoregulator-binding transcription factor [Actinomycetota bacterium]
MCSTGPPRPGAGGSEAYAGRARLQSRAQATRQAILSAAAEHFARNGYHATSLDSVLADSGGTKGALYFHFASKEALARAVIAEMVQRWGDLREQVSERGLDPLSTLLALVDEVITRLIDNPIARGGTRLLGELPMRSQDAPEHYGFGERYASDLLAEAAQSGLLREGIEPSLVARQIVAIIAGHRQICDALGNRHDLWQRIDEAWAFLLPVIATDVWLAAWHASALTRPPRHGGISSPETP